MILTLWLIIKGITKQNIKLIDDSIMSELGTLIAKSQCFKQWLN